MPSHVYCYPPQNPYSIPELLDLRNHNRTQRQLRTFTVASSSRWNKLPSPLRLHTNTTIVQSKVKTHLFRLSYK